MRGERPTSAPVTLTEHVESYWTRTRSAATRRRSTSSGSGSATRPASSAICASTSSSGACPEVAAWTTTLPAGSRYGIVQALRQCLEAAVRWGLIGSNPAKLAGRNPQPKRDEVEHVRARRGRAARRRARPGLRPARRSSPPTQGCARRSGSALEWRDVDRHDGVLTVERAVLVRPREGAEDEGQLVARGAAACSRSSGARAIPRDASTPGLCSPARAASYIDLRNWRKREWKPALEAAGAAASGGPTTCDHSFASWALAAGVPAYDMARYMGTSRTDARSPVRLNLLKGFEPTRFGVAAGSLRQQERSNRLAQESAHVTGDVD